MSSDATVSLPSGNAHSEIKPSQTFLTAKEKKEIVRLSRALVCAGASIIENDDSLQLSEKTDRHCIEMMSATQWPPSDDTIARLLDGLRESPAAATTTTTLLALHKQWWVSHQAGAPPCGSVPDPDWPDPRPPPAARDLVNRFSRARVSLGLDPDATIFLLLGRAVPLKTASTKTLAALVNSTTKRTLPAPAIIAAVRAAMPAPRLSSASWDLDTKAGMSHVRFWEAKTAGSGTSDRNKPRLASYSNDPTCRSQLSLLPLPLGSFVFLEPTCCGNGHEWC
ncbi:hypothetical protein LX32DRAFT_732702 [Colletotrichum zoysiae]|uniref:Uncharacterized protein n=1 Tax=Colletotrichum zoysiae TaxID=1216348 RepID=A0AAD9H737_9PEZI|nr:hypothetical protein LX32DRAFT_732702 [Colletotrichum zoysiae]